MKFGVDWMLQNAAKERNQVANEWWQYLSGGEASCFCAEPATGRKKRGEEDALCLATQPHWVPCHGRGGSSAWQGKGEQQEVNQETVLTSMVLGTPYVGGGSSVLLFEKQEAGGRKR
jgi:hypothetical protein